MINKILKEKLHKAVVTDLAVLLPTVLQQNQDE